MSATSTLPTLVVSTPVGGEGYLPSPSPPSPSSLYSYYSDEEADQEVIQYVTKEKLARFFKVFEEMPEKEDLMMVKSCSLEKKEKLIKGELFVTRNFLCFYGKFFGKKCKSILPVRSIAKISKGKKLGFIANSIRIRAKDHSKMILVGFRKRDAVYDFLNVLWKTTMDPVFQEAQQALQREPSKLLESDGIIEQTVEVDPAGATGVPLDDDFVVTREEYVETSPGAVSPLQGEKVVVITAKPEPLVLPPRSEIPVGLVNPANSALDTPYLFVSVEEERPPQEVFSMPEKVYRPRRASIADSTRSYNTASSGSPTEVPIMSVPPSQNDRHAVVVKAKEKSRKKEEREERREEKRVEPSPSGLQVETMMAQRTVLNEVFSLEVPEVFDLLFGPGNSLVVPCRSELQSGVWESVAGVEARQIFYVQVTKTGPKGAEFMTLCKYREDQRIEEKKDDHCAVYCEAMSLDQEIMDGVCIGTTYTMKGLTDEETGIKKTRLVIASQVKLIRAGVSTETSDVIHENAEMAVKEISAFLTAKASDKQARKAKEEKKEQTIEKIQELTKDAPHQLVVNWHYALVAAACIILLIYWLFFWPEDPLTVEEVHWRQFMKEEEEQLGAGFFKTKQLYNEYRLMMSRMAEHLQSEGNKAHALLSVLQPSTLSPPPVQADADAASTLAL